MRTPGQEPEGPSPRPATSPSSSTNSSVSPWAPQLVRLHPQIRPIGARVRPPGAVEVQAPGPAPTRPARRPPARWGRRSWAGRTSCGWTARPRWSSCRPPPRASSPWTSRGGRCSRVRAAPPRRRARPPGPKRPASRAGPPCPRRPRPRAPPPRRPARRPGRKGWSGRPGSQSRGGRARRAPAGRTRPPPAGTGGCPWGPWREAGRSGRWPSQASPRSRARRRTVYTGASPPAPARPIAPSRERPSRAEKPPATVPSARLPRGSPLPAAEPAGGSRFHVSQRPEVKGERGCVSGLREGRGKPGSSLGGGAAGRVTGRRWTAPPALLRSVGGVRVLKSLRDVAELLPKHGRMPSALWKFKLNLSLSDTLYDRNRVLGTV